MSIKALALPFLAALAVSALACASADPQADDAAEGSAAVTADAPLAPGEPAYCTRATFKPKAIAIDEHGINRGHAYRLGQVTLIGLGVGDSDNDAVKALAQSHAPSLDPTDNACTFYFNDGNRKAETDFNWFNLPKPTGQDYPAMVAEYSRILADAFDVRPTSFVSCADKHHYLAMGCDGMRHRGPTVFAAMLAYAGCSPEHATAIVNDVWGDNGIKAEMRVAIATWAADLGKRHPAESAKLRHLFEGVE